LNKNVSGGGRSQQKGGSIPSRMIVNRKSFRGLHKKERKKEGARRLKPENKKKTDNCEKEGGGDGKGGGSRNSSGRDDPAMGSISWGGESIKPGLEPKGQWGAWSYLQRRDIGRETESCQVTSSGVTVKTTRKNKREKDLRPKKKPETVVKARGGRSQSNK